LRAACVAGLGALGYHTYQLTERSRGVERELRQQLALAAVANSAQAREREVARARIGYLEQEEQKLGGQLEQAAAQKEATQAELDRVRGELAAKLEREIKLGEVVVEQRGDALVVDVADKVLFDTGKSDINDNGQKVLRQVAGAIQANYSQPGQVGPDMENIRDPKPQTQGLPPEHLQRVEP
jgi:chemotaxis protein MotB